MGGKTSLLTPLINYKALVLCVRLKKCQLMKGVFQTRAQLAAHLPKTNSALYAMPSPLSAPCEYYYMYE